MKNDEMGKTSLDGNVYRRGRTVRIVAGLVMLGWLDKGGDIVYGIGSRKA